MRIGIFTEDAHTIDDAVDAAGSAADDGFASFWMPQIFGLDALTTLAVVGREVPGIGLGTAVVPTYPRHPMMLAAQALTTQQASDGRLTLGIGLSHQPVIENMFGYSFDKPLRHMREYLSALMPLLRGEDPNVDGETLKAHGAVDVAGVKAPPVLVAALGPKMLELAGRETQGTVTWMTGPATLAEHTVPAITASASAAGRAAPRVVGALPVCVTDDVDGTRARAAKALEIYGFLPSYRAMLDREGAKGPADVAIIGDEAVVQAGIGRIEQAGVTEFVAVEFAPPASADRARTRDLLRSLL